MVVLRFKCLKLSNYRLRDNVATKSFRRYVKASLQYGNSILIYTYIYINVNYILKF